MIIRKCVCEVHPIGFFFDKMQTVHIVKENGDELLAVHFINANYLFSVNLWECLSHLGEFVVFSAL